jgi:hypothetical protein
MNRTPLSSIGLLEGAHRVLAGLALAVGGLLGGCNYARNRVNDLLDPFQCAVGVGPGLYADVRVTDFAATGLGCRDMTAVGALGRHVITEAEMHSLGAGVVVWQLQTIHDSHPSLPGDPSQPGLLLWSATQMLIVLPVGAGICDGYSLSERGLHAADLRAGVGLGYLGLDIGFSPGQFVDLLLGFVGIDLAGDDVFGSTPSEPASADAAEPASR